MPHAIPKPWGVKNLMPWFKFEGGEEKTVGEVRFRGAANSPILVKFIFSSKPLSIQVHPNGSTEAWHVLRARRDAKIASGFTRKITKDEIRKACQSSEIVRRLAWFPAKRGDTFQIPFHTVHTIGAGLVLCEVKRKPDVSYRLYDYGRAGPHRRLSLGKAISLCDRGPWDPRPKRPGDSLVSCPSFRIRKLTTRGTFRHHLESDRSGFLVVIAGSGKVAGEQTKLGDVWYANQGGSSFDVSGRGMELLDIQWTTP